MTLPSGRRGPGRLYGEAFPMLDVHEVLRAAGEGRGYVEWRDEDGLVVGYASVQALSETEARFFFTFYGTRNVERGVGLLEVELSRSAGGQYWRKPSFLCPKCRCAVTRLFWVRGYWACKNSHDLCGIAQRLTPINKAIHAKQVHERRLKEQTGLGNTKQQAERRKEKYGRAVSLLAGDHRSELPWQLQFRTHGRWLEPGAVPTRVDVREEIGYGWEAGMSGQLPGLYPDSAYDEPTRQRAPVAPPVATPAPPQGCRRVPRAKGEPALPLSPSSRAPGFAVPVVPLGLGLADMPSFGDLFPPLGRLWPEEDDG